MFIDVYKKLLNSEYLYSKEIKSPGLGKKSVNKSKSPKKDS